MKLDLRMYRMSAGGEWWEYERWTEMDDAYGIHEKRRDGTSR